MHLTRNQLLSNHRKPSGFALIATITVMSLLMLIAVAMMSFSSVEQKSTQQGQALRQAQANARMALMIAIGELQETAGADQRSTAAGDLIISTGAADKNNRRNWVGIWRTDDYDQSDPETKTFVKWLASNNENGGLATEAGITAYENTNPVVIFEAGNPNDDNEINDVVVDRVTINDANSNSLGSYAYWVSDEGTKASFLWNEGSYDEARLTSSPGFDNGVFSGGGSPISPPAYPLNSSNHLLSNGNKILSLGGVTLAGGASSSNVAWLNEHYHDITSVSYGVLADMKLGGLKRDLSLAFEMDGTADYGTNEMGLATSESRPADFDAQVGEFVGGNDRLSAPVAHNANNGIAERYVYRNVNGDGSWFGDDIDQITFESYPGVSRGTNWWNLRDFSQLYKRLQTSSNGYALAARAMYPNRITNTSHGSTAYDLTAITGLNMNYQPARSQYADRDTNSGFEGYVPYPSRGSYAPVLVGSSCFISVKNQDGNLAVVLDPVFQLWNPYNVAITANRYAIVSQDAFPGLINIKVQSKDEAGAETEKIVGPFSIGQLVNQDQNFKTGAAAGQMSFLISDLTLAPGEVMLFSPADATILNNTRNVNMTMNEGVNIDEGSGIVITSLLVSDIEANTAEFKNIALANDDTISYVYHNSIKFKTGRTEVDKNGDIVEITAGQGRLRVTTFLPASTVSADDLGSAGNRGDVLQYKQSNTSATQSIIAEGYDIKKGATNESDLDYLGGDTAEVLTAKKTFGGISRLNRAGVDARSKVQGENNIGHMEVYTHFNPAEAVTTAEMWREAEINKMFTMVCKEGGYNAIRDSLAVDYPFGAGQQSNGYYGNSFDSTNNGSTHFQLKSIPIRPMYSLLELRGATTAVHSHEPFSPLGESFPSPFVDPSGVFDTYEYHVARSRYASIGDHSWLFNDALFDRYYFSGIAPKFTIGSSGYSLESGASLDATLSEFYGVDYTVANANNVLIPYVPSDLDSATIRATLDDAEGYKKMAAYSLINGQFNVNSTSVRAWAALLMANRDVDVDYADSSSADSEDGVPFPGGSQVIKGVNAEAGWVGLSRLSDEDIWNDKGSAADTSDDTGLAVEIVNEVRKRGPFMSLADFINRRPGGTNDTDIRGALQAALENSGIYADFHSSYEDTNYGSLTYFNYTENKKTSTGIAGDITQSKILLPIASRLNARSDTFKIRAYGESSTGVVAYCEAVVQRLPEYVNATNDPWDDPMKNPLPMTTLVPKDATDGFNGNNAKYGRMFKIVSFRWLADSEI